MDSLKMFLAIAGSLFELTTIKVQYLTVEGEENETGKWIPGKFEIRLGWLAFYQSFLR